MLVIPLLAQPLADKTPGFDSGLLDRTTDPCRNFYQFACGNWLTANPVPADRPIWGRLRELDQRNLELLRGILEEAASKKPGRTSVEQKIGDHYAACMDEAAAEKKGSAPLKPWLVKVDRLANVAGVAELLPALSAAGALFGFGSAPDYRNSSQRIASISAGGLSLPERSYYLEKSDRMAGIRSEFLSHVTKMFELLGEDRAGAAKHAAEVMDFETKLAEETLDRVSRRDPRKLDNRMKVRDLAALAPSFDWQRYFRAANAPAFSELNVTEPAFVKRINELTTSAPLGQWKSYLRWRMIRTAAPMLSSDLRDEDFRFSHTVLTGVKRQPPRWRTCVAKVDADLGEALGQQYVEKAFRQESRARMDTMVKMLGAAMEKDIRELPWMTAVTKERAIEKLKSITNKIGHPTKWRDYSRVRIVPGDFLGNVLRANAELERRGIERIETPVDKTEWNMTPPTVNAYYSGSMNSINFPAGILQPPFFDPKMDDAVNYGAIGAVIGHELTHGFDDQGSKFDANGNLRNWWTEEDRAEFQRRAQCFVDQYAAYDGAKGAKLNGKLTLGENTADNGGLRVAYMALMLHLAGKEAPPVEGFTPSQRFFLGWGQVWCRNATEEEARRRVLTDPHSPGEHRVNGVVSNMPEFRQAFGCSAGQPMVRDNACRVW
jgi:endothelin-converting enzyme/putative endopeptidase